MLSAELVAGIILEALKLLNWQLANLPKDKAEAAATRFDETVAFWTRWMPKAPTAPAS